MSTNCVSGTLALVAGHVLRRLELAVEVEVREFRFPDRGPLDLSLCEERLVLAYVTSTSVGSVPLNRVITRKTSRMIADQLRTTFRTLFQLKSSSGRKVLSRFLVPLRPRGDPPFIVGPFAGAVVGVFVSSILSCQDFIL